MLERVRQRFLHDPKRGQVDPGGQLDRRPLDVQLDVAAGGPQLLHQRIEGAEPRLRRDHHLLIAGAQHAEQPPQLGQRLAAAGLDGAERPAGVAGVAQQLRPGLGLHDHHRHGVRDHVVQLPGDPGALLDHGLVSGQVAFPLGQLSTSLAVAHHAAHDQHHHQRAQRPQRALTVHRAGDEIGDQDRGHAERELAGRRPHSEPVQRAQVGDGIGDDLRVAADGDAEPHRDPSAGAREGRVAPSIGDGQAQSRGQQRRP